MLLATCCLVYEALYTDIAATAAGTVAALAEERKITNSPISLFHSSFKTMGAMHPKARLYLGARIMTHTGDPHSYSYLMQCLSVVIQNSHMVSVFS